MIIMAVTYDASEWTMKNLKGHFKTIFKYLNWEDAGILLVTEVSSRSSTRHLNNPEQAYMIERNLHLILQNTERRASNS